MSPNARGRARDKNHPQTRQSKREVEQRRSKQSVFVVLAMVVVIGGFVGLSLALNKDDKTAAVQAPPTPKALVAGCGTAPNVPADIRKATLPDKATAAGKTFTAQVVTSCGVITVELDGTRAPQTVASFLGLARSGYWANSPCHRLTTTPTLFVLQCGDPTGTGSGSPGYSFGVENAPANFKYAPGTLAMARTPDPNSNGGQFFIVYEETVLQDKVGYSVFGRVTSGMDIVDRVAAAGATPQSDDSQNTAPMQPISILTVNVAEKKA